MIEDLHDANAPFQRSRAINVCRSRAIGLFFPPKDLQDKHLKPCPFCKEHVRDEAIKCRFCKSMLLPLPSESDRVTYILDRDHVRFGKFAGSVLAVFLVVGAYLFGFKLDTALEKVQKTQEELTEAQHDLEGAQATVRHLKSDVETNVGRGQEYSCGNHRSERRQPLQ